MLGLGYARLAQTTDILLFPQDFKQYQDSAITFFEMAIPLFSEELIKKQDFFYEEVLPALRSTEEKLSVKDVVSWVEEQKKEITKLSEQANELFSELSKTQTAISGASAYHQSVRQRFPELMDIYMLSEDGFSILKDSLMLLEKTVGNNAKNFNLLTDVFVGNTSLLQLKTFEIEDYPFPNNSTFITADSLITLYSFNTWLDSIGNYRQDKIKLLRRAIVEIEKLLDRKLEEVEKDTLILSEAFEIDSLLAQPILASEAQSLPMLLFNYKVAKVNMLSDYLAEKSFLPYEEGREGILNYYFTLKSHTKRCQDLLDNVRIALKEEAFLHHSDFLEKYYAGEKGLKSYLDHEQKTINEKGYYCNIKIKDQLVYSYLEQRFLPKYVEYEGKKIALFEQSPNLVVEKDHFITTRVSKTQNGEMYVTGFQKSSEKTPFVAKVVSRQVVWLKTLEEEQTGRKKNHFGTVLTPTSTGCLLIVRAFQKKIYTDSSAVNTLFELDAEGNILTKVHLQERMFPEHSLKVEEDSSYIVAYRSKPGGRDFLPEMLVASIDIEGNTQWEKKFPVESRITRLHKVKDRYFMVSNIVNLRDSNGNLISRNSKKAGDSNVFAAVFDIKGTLVAKKFVRSQTSHFSTYAIPYNETGLLVMGFKGLFNLNALPDKPVMNILFDKDLNIVSSNLNAEETLP
ncbi:hypothetical protein R9C00_24780 [Flammeovirgaceae bacterium SG7u.111]|nr:hypothetical protein [Flammeovirgaceae bacterium SG7u.132]WPO34914.1 hypothetical protein R9C00_24780 [Flammeovirgaceae bacterium SG7u.111]